MRLITAALVLLGSIPLYAIQDKSLYFSFSGFAHNLSKTTQSSSGDAAFIGPVYYPVGLQTAFELGSEWSLAPLLEYTLFFPRTSPDGGETANYLLLNLPFVKRISGDRGSGWDLNVGPDLLFYSVKGNGGTATLNNGSSTAVFALPSGTQSSRTVALDLGLAYNSDPSRFSLDVLAEGLLSNYKRTFSILLTFQYNLVAGGGR